jgi:hypothetical protein
MIYNLNLDATIADVRAKFHRRDRFLQWESMRNQLVEIENPSGQSANPSRPSIRISVDEF